MATLTFSEPTHTYTDENGAIVISVTQVLSSAGLIDFSMVSPAVLERKQRLGTLVHQAAQLYDAGENLNDYDIPSEVLEYLDGYANFRSDCNFTPEFIEHGLCGEIHGMRYAGRLDRTGNINDVPTVLELKCGASQSPAWRLQLAGYDLALPKLRRDRAVIHLGPQFPRGYKVHSYTDPSDYQVFLAALAIAIWKQNQRLATAPAFNERIEL